ncbi:MAG: Glucosyl-3-phosphoglycerate synthase, partial [Actinomycetota bacterium]
LVLDVARTQGVGAIAQVDLGARTHRHHDLATLGRMATEVLAVALDRLSREGRLDARSRDALGDAVTLWQPVRDGEGLRLEPHTVRAPRPGAPAGGA